MASRNLQSRRAPPTAAKKREPGRKERHKINLLLQRIKDGAKAATSWGQKME